MSKKFALILTTLIFLMSIGSSSIEADEQNTTVSILFLMPYTSVFPSSELLIEGVKESLEATDYTINYAYEYLDLGRFPNDDSYLAEAADFFRKKYTNRLVPDYVITMDALKPFLIEYGDELFPGARKFLTLNAIAETDENLQDDVISVIQVDDMVIKNNLDLIKKLFPDKKNIYFIVGDSEYERRTVAQIKEVQKEYDSELSFHFTADLSYHQMLEEVESLGNYDVVCFLQWSVDNQGKSYVPVEVVKEVCEVASVPVFGAGSQFLGLGILGGYVYDFKVIGNRIGDELSDLIEGKKVSENLIQLSSYHYVFDSNQLKKYGVSEENLPAGSSILYAQESFWETYKVQIIIVSVLIILQIIYIFILIRNISRRKRAETQLVALNKLLENEVEVRTNDLEIANRKLSESNDALEIRNKEMEHLATIDRLTNISNRLKLDELVKNELERYKRTGDIFSLIMVDIDFFKKINDQYGHPVGDLILSECAVLMKENIRAIDTVGRWGGEEFLVVCPDTKAEGAIVLAESLRKKVEINVFAKKIKITISLGVSQVLESDSDELTLFKRADDALYYAKNNGRNIVAYKNACEFEFLKDNHR
ncbi:diguanylate cyclase [Eubacteriaceae bacterium ES3]|nr:diguanylate cyclase [Eubacteriaceae bacterium ES3]